MKNCCNTSVTTILHKQSTIDHSFLSNYPAAGKIIQEGGRDIPPVAALYSAIWLPFLPAISLAPLVGQQSQHHFHQHLDVFIHVTYICWCLNHPASVCMLTLHESYSVSAQSLVTWHVRISKYDLWSMNGQQCV